MKIGDWKQCTKAETFPITEKGSHTRNRIIFEVFVPFIVLKFRYLTLVKEDEANPGKNATEASVLVMAWCPWNFVSKCMDFQLNRTRL